MKTMVIGILQVELFIGDATNLKDKRRVLASLKDRLHRSNAVAVAEVGEMDTHQRAVLGIVTVSNAGPHARSVLDKIVADLRDSRRFVLADHRIEIMSGN